MTDPLTIRDHKAALRRDMASSIAQMMSQERADADRAIPRRFRAWLMDHTSRDESETWTDINFLAFMPLPDEPEITSLLLSCINFGGSLVLPRVESYNTLALCPVRNLGEDLDIGRYDILEPRIALPHIEPEDIDIVLLPGRAFTPHGDRLGRGKGYYDRLLNQMDAIRVAVAYDCQIVEDLPTEETDVPVHFIVTPTRTLDCR